LRRALVKDDILQLVNDSPKDVFVGSPSMIVACTNLGLIDEFQLCIHPVISTGGIPLFQHVKDRHVLRLTGSKTFGSGAIVLTYSVSS
jgi:dihydrofolate reductase